MSLPTNFFIGRGGAAPKLDITAPSNFVYIYENNGPSGYEQYSVNSSGIISNTYNTSVSDGDGDQLAAAALSTTKFVKVQSYNERMDQLQLSGGFTVQNTDTNLPFTNTQAQLSVVGCGPSKWCYLYSDGSDIKIDSVDGSIAAGQSQNSVTSNMGNAATTSQTLGRRFSLQGLKIPTVDKMLITNKNSCEIIDYSTFNNLSKEGTVNLNHTGNWNTIVYTDNPEVMAIITVATGQPNSGAAMRVSYIGVSGNSGPTLLGTATLANTYSSPGVYNAGCGTGPWAYYCGNNRFVYAETGAVLVFEMDPKNYTATQTGYAGFTTRSNRDNRVMWMGENIVGSIGVNTSSNSQIDVRSFTVAANGSITAADTFNQNLSYEALHTVALPLYNLP